VHDVPSQGAVRDEWGSCSVSHYLSSVDMDVGRGPRGARGLPRCRARGFRVFGWLALLTLVAGTGCGGGGGESSPSTPAALQLWLGFDEDSGAVAKDASGQGNDAQTLHGAGWGPGQIDGGLQLDGVDDVAAVSNSPSLDGLRQALTVAAWVRRAKPQTGWRLAVSRQLGTTFEDQFYVGFNGTKPSFGINTASGGNQQTGGGNAAVGRWVHLAGVYDGATITLYVDGVAEASLTKRGAIKVSSRPILVGGGANTANALTASETLAGRVDDVRLYTRALDANEIQTLASGS
jgi:Concanavalin A-like lectin/glucanases superfamily